MAYPEFQQKGTLGVPLKGKEYYSFDETNHFHSSVEGKSLEYKKSSSNQEEPATIELPTNLATVVTTAVSAVAVIAVVLPATASVPTLRSSVVNVSATAITYAFEVEFVQAGKLVVKLDSFDSSFSQNYTVGNSDEAVALPATSSSEKSTQILDGSFDNLLTDHSYSLTLSSLSDMGNSILYQAPVLTSGRSCPNDAHIALDTAVNYENNLLSYTLTIDDPCSYLSNIYVQWYYGGDLTTLQKEDYSSTMVAPSVSLDPKYKGTYLRFSVWANSSYRNEGSSGNSAPVQYAEKAVYY